MASQQQRSLANLLVSVMHAREEDGARVSRVLHDEVGQVLSAIGLQLDLLRMDLNENVADCSRRVLDIQKVLEQAVAQVRDLSYELNPSIVERTGLQFALDRLLGRHRKDFSGSMRLTFDSSVRLPLVLATALYKISEQAIENAVQHSKATRIEVMVKRGRSGVTLEIRDDGAGFSRGRQAEDSQGLGLHLMRYHAAHAGLRFSVVSVPEKGTIVKAICRIAKLPGDPAGESLD